MARLQNIFLKYVLSVVFIFLLCGGMARGATLTVCKSPGSCDYDTIQAGMSNAISGVDSVLVSDGTYVETIDFLGKAITVQSVSGTAATIIDGGASGPVVTFSNGEGSGSVLDGFTIQNGSSVSNGGGIFCNGASPAITDCVVTGNFGSESGGGIHLQGGASPAITGCTITGNSSGGSPTGGGGGISCWSSSPTVTDSTISDNTSGYGGGGIFGAAIITGCTITGNTASSPGGDTYGGGGIFGAAIITDSIISNNTANQGNGGGLYLPGGQVTDSIITGNTAYQDGGGIYAGGNAVITGCSIEGNTAKALGGHLGHGGGGVTLGTWATLRESYVTGNVSEKDGGGVMVGGSYNVNIENSTITGNIAQVNGGGVHLGGEQVTLTNNTIAGNMAFTGRGGGIYLSWIMVNWGADVNNCILWGDKAGDSFEEIHLADNASVTVTYSDVKGGWAGTGNIAVKPLFVDFHPASEAPTSAGDYHLKIKSPCKDAGTGAFAPEHDIDGDPRPLDGGHDMGSDEFSTEVDGNLLTNFSFEEGDLRPYFWEGNKLRLRDKRVSATACNRNYSLRVIGSKASKSLKQEYVVDGQAGDTLVLSGWSRAKGTSRRGGRYCLDLKVYFDDASVMTFRKGFRKRTHWWQRRVVTVTVNKPYYKIEGILRYARQTGRAWFDAIGLVID